MIRYRIVTNGKQYKIQELCRPLHLPFLKEKWMDWEGYYGKYMGTKEMCENTLKRWKEEDCLVTLSWNPI